jgi:alpha-mannosidase
LLSIEETGPIRVVLKVVHPLSKVSTLNQKIIIHANSRQIQFENEIDWHENRKILKVEFPLLIKNDQATYETQFGYIQRPTHFNNSWDMARFEVCGHKFVDFSEYGYGVSLFNDSKYGFSVKDNVMRMSLLRAPKSPDDNCDMGIHTFKYALEPHSKSFHDSRAVQKGYEFNLPLEASISSVSCPPKSLFSVDKDNVIIDTVKKEHVGGPCVVVRMFEAYGGRCSVTFTRYANYLSQRLSNQESASQQYYRGTARGGACC